MKIIIKTAGNHGKELKRLMEKRMPDAEIIGFTDNDCNKWNTICEGITIYSPFKCTELIKNKEVDKVVIPMRHGYLLVKSMFFELNGLGISEEDILIASVNIYDMHSELNIKNAFIKIQDFNYIRMNYCSTLKCNLNCKRCNVCSPIHKDDTIDTFEDFKKYVLRLKQIIHHIDVFQFLGGEPLLQDDIGECIKFLHCVYPITKIVIYTNGLLIKSMSDGLLQIIKDYNVKIIMSAYPIMTDKMEGIFDYLQSKHIKNTSVAAYINDFSPVFCEEKEFPYQTIENLCYCYTFYRGGLSACGHFHSMKKFNETFGTNYEYEEGIIDIFDENLKPSDIMPRLTKPYKLCNVCNYYKIRGGLINPVSGLLSQTRKWDYYKAGEQPKAEDWF